MIAQQGETSTLVSANNYCASACFVVFSAGRARYFWGSSQIGVHSVSTKNENSGQPGETTEAMAGTLKMARILSNVGVPAPNPRIEYWSGNGKAIDYCTYDPVG